MSPEQPPAGISTRTPLGQRWLGALLPVLVLGAMLLGWDMVVRVNAIPPYILPGPLLVLRTLIADWPSLSQSLWVTLRVTLLALLAATVGGVALALLFARARWLELSLYPVAVVLQVTPVIAIAPLMVIYLEPDMAVLACAFIVAFFPILSNTLAGLNGVDRNLRDLFHLYGASPTAELLRLRLPAALPHFLAGLRISGGLALIGAIVAEIAAGSAGQGTGLAFRIVEAGYRLDIARMYAALALISLAGIAIFALLSLLSRLLLRNWHDSAIPRDD